jgi:gliding motility-associated-like protein
VNLKLLFFLALITISSVAQNKNKTIGFKENKGQIIDQKGKPNNAVKYLLNSGGLNVQLRNNGFSYDVYEAKKHPIKHSHDEKKKPLPFPSKDNENLPDYTLEYQYHRIDIDFVNSNPKLELLTEQQSLDYDNYYNIPNKPEGVLMVHQYKQITYKNIYPNIDVVFTIPKDTLKTVEYNFVVHPKGKISDIKLKFSGAQTELVDNKIKMLVRFGEMEETLPASWTEDGELKKEIAVGYTKIKNNVYGFASSENASDKTVIIDPVPTRLWGTYYGDETDIHYNLGHVSLTTDYSGNAYMAGTTTASNSSYATTGAHQASISPSFYGSANGIIVKFSPSGNRLWGTYYGGQGHNSISDIKVDSQNNVVISGFTIAKSNISTMGSYQPNLTGGGYDAFLVKFNDLGIRLWGTYFGGYGSDFASSLDIDKNNNIFIAGNTSSESNIAINSNFQTQLNQTTGFNTDGLLAKFNAEGNLIWSTYVGGEDEDKLNTIVVKDNYIITGGVTKSYNNISTPGVFQQIHDPIALLDGTVYKFSLDGKRIWSTYYGGKQDDYVYSIDADDDDNIYLGGETSSDNNIATPSSFDSTNTSSLKGFFAKLNSNGKRIWGSYMEAALVYSLIFRNNSIYVGATNEGYYNQKLTNSCSYKSKQNIDGYIAKFSKDADFIWGTYVGGNSPFETTKIALDNNNMIFVSGISSNSNDIADSNSYQPNVLGSFDNYFLMKFSEENSCNIKIIPKSNSPVCITNTLVFSDVPSGYHYDWTGPNGFTSNVQNPTISNINTTNSGLYTLVVSDGSNCGCKMTYKLNVIVGDEVAPIPNLATLPTITRDCHTLITTIPTATDACAGSISATTSSPLSYTLPGIYTVIWDYSDGNGNISHQNQTVTINNQPLPTATTPQTFCIQQNGTINDITITGQNIKWYDKLTTGSLLLNTTPLQNGTTYYASQTLNGCESERIPVVAKIQNTPTPTANATQSFCTGQNPTLNTIAISGTNLKWYDSSALGNLLTDTTPLVDGKTYYVSQTIDNCESIGRLAVTVSLISSLPANDYDLSICDDLNDGTEYAKLEDFNSFLISNTANYNFSYYKSLPAAENQAPSNKITTASNYKLALGENKIYVRINSNTPCYAIAVLKINLFSKPIIPIQDIVPICENNTILVDAGSGASSYLWSNGKTTQTITIDSPADLTVTATKNYGTLSCSSNKTFKVKTSNIAKITAVQTKDWTDDDNTITVFATGAGDYEYSIDGLNYQNSNQFSGVNSGEYTVHARDKNGCGTAVEEVYLLMYPKFFTPNGDGSNDTWKIKSSDIEKEITLKIYDRFGKLIKVINSNSNGWDGTYIGQTLPATDYWFVVTRKNGKEYTGHFSLRR